MKIIDNTKLLEASLLVEHDSIINDKQREMILEISKLILGFGIDNLEYYSQLKFKKKTLYLKYQYRWGSLDLTILKEKPKYNIGSFYKDGVEYEDPAAYKDDKRIDLLNRYFNINIKGNKIKDASIYDILGICIPRQTGFHTYYSDIVEFLIKELPEDIKNKYSEEVTRNKISSYEPISIVIKVWENKNYRTALLREGNNYKLLIAEPEHRIYNYLDEDRFIWIVNEYRWAREFIAFDILSNINDFDIIYNQYKNFRKQVEKTGTYDEYEGRQISDDDILTNSNRFQLAEAKRLREEKIAEIKNRKYKEAIENMNKVPFEKNGIKFTQYTMEYENVKVDLNKLYSFKKYLEANRIDNMTDFNDILNTALKTIGMYWVEKHPTWTQSDRLRSDHLVDRYSLADKKAISFTVDGKEINLAKETLKKSTKYTINGKRINKFEIGEVLTHILCHTTIESYEKFLDSVSSCSLKFHKVIAQNIKKNYGYGNDANNVELKIVRKKNKNYLTLDKKDYQINDTNRLIDTNVNSMKDFVLLIIETVNMDISKLKPLIKEGKERYEKALAKSKELLENTKKKFDVKEETIGDTKGLTVLGKSGIKYLIQDSHDNQFKTWIVRPNGNLDYRCIVDKTHKGQVGKDALVSRIFALANDVLVAKDIYTLQRDVATAK